MSGWTVRTAMRGGSMWCRRFCHTCRAPHPGDHRDTSRFPLVLLLAVECLQLLWMRSPVRCVRCLYGAVCTGRLCQCVPQNHARVSVFSLLIAALSVLAVDAHPQILTIPIGSALRGSVQRGLSAADSARMKYVWGGRQINAIRYMPYPRRIQNMLNG